MIWYIVWVYLCLPGKLGAAHGFSTLNLQVSSGFLDDPWPSPRRDPCPQAPRPPHCARPTRSRSAWISAANSRSGRWETAASDDGAPEVAAWRRIPKRNVWQFNIWVIESVQNFDEMKDLRKFLSIHSISKCLAGKTIKVMAFLWGSVPKSRTQSRQLTSSPSTTIMISTT